MTRQLSTAEVARLVGLPEPRIRELVRRGLCRPGRRGRAYAFTFQDVVVLRAARSLQEARVPARRVRRALESLARELPPGRSLSGVRIYADGRQVAVCDGGAAWVPETGQTLFTFEVDGLARQVAALRRAPAGPDPQARARALFEEALDLDGVDDAAAARAYRRALELDPELADAWVNLGRLLQEAGEPRGAAECAREALRRGPDDPIVHFNLALALEDTAGPEPAARHYERALALDPDFADAHFNLAGVYEKLGRERDALRHYGAYRKLRED